MFFIVFLIVALILTGFFFFSSVCLQLYEKKYLGKENEEKLFNHKKFLFIYTYLISFAILFMTLTFEKLVIILPIYIFIIILLLLLSICKFMKKDFLLYFLCGTIIAISMILFNIISFTTVFNDCDSSEIMTNLDIQQFNNRFQNYEGNRVKGSKVKSLLQEVVTTNLSQEDSNRKISTTGIVNIGKEDSSVATNNIKRDSTYIVQCIISDGNENAATGANKYNKGLVCQIQILDAEPTSTP